MPEELLVDALRESEKELRCLTAISQMLSGGEPDMEASLKRIVALIPPAWKYPERTAAEIEVRDLRVRSAARTGGPAVTAKEPLIVEGKQIGYLSVSVRTGSADEGTPVILDSERRLLSTLAGLLSHLIFRHEVSSAVEESARNLEAKSAALREVISHIDEEKNSAALRFQTYLHTVVLPVVRRLRTDNLNQRQRELYLDELESAVRDFDAGKPLLRSAFGVILSPREVEIADLIRQGLSTKELAEDLSLSELTIERHRHNIRQKLGISGTKINLTTYLRQTH